MYNQHFAILVFAILIALSSTNVIHMLRSMMTQPKNVLVIGGSYVGLNLAESLATSSRGRFRIMVIEKNSHFQHLFAFPRYAVTTKVDTHKGFIPYQASRLGQDGAFFQAKAINLNKDTVTLDREVDLDGVSTKEIPYAALAITTGTKLSPPSTLPSSDKVTGTTYLRRHAEQVERSSNIVIIGGGAVGVQTATDIKEIYPNKTVTLVHSRAQLMPKFHPKFHSLISQSCTDLGINFILNHGRAIIPSEGFPTDGSTFPIRLADDTTVSADMAVIAIGQTPQSEILTTLSPSSIQRDSYISVLPTLQISNPEFPNIFALGDVAATKAPKAARPAIAQAQVVTKNIMTLLGNNDGNIKDVELEKYEPTDPAAIHLTLGIEKSVIFRNPVAQGEEPTIMWKDDGKLDLGIERVWGSRGADVQKAWL
jgi:NADH dehydrogenase FAD-containing subunit